MKMKKKIILALTIIASGIFIVSCKKQDTGTGNIVLNIILTDGPSIIFDSVFIDIQKADIKIEKTDGTESVQPLSIQPGIYNIMRYRNGIEILLGSVTLPAGSKIEKLILTLGTKNSAMKNNVSYPLALHNNVNTFTVNINDDVDNDGDDNHKKSWLDFDAANSIIEISPGHFELNPSLHNFSRHGSGEVEGKVLPAAGQPVIVTAISGTDTLSTRTEAEGEFKIRGIHSSSVKLIIHPSNNYKDSIINNIPLTQGMDTKISTIVLHQ
jgi:hypothetical protein